MSAETSGKVLVTGGSGFLGINLIRYLMAKGLTDVRSLDLVEFDYPEKDRVDESVGEQEKLDGNEDSQTAKDRVDEIEGETEEVEEPEGEPAATPEVEKPTEEVEADKQPAPGDGTMENPKDEVHEALNARIAALEETLHKVLEKLENQDFGGIKANSTEKVENDALSEDDRIMRSYYGNSYRR